MAGRNRVKCHNLAQFCSRIADFRFSDFKQTHFEIRYPVKGTLQWQNGDSDRTLQVLQTLPKYVYVEIWVNQDSQLDSQLCILDYIIMEIANNRIWRLSLKTKLSKPWTKKERLFFYSQIIFWQLKFFSTSYCLQGTIRRSDYSIIDFLVDGQISSFCPNQHEAKLLTLIMLHKLTQSL